MLQLSLSKSCFWNAKDLCFYQFINHVSNKLVYIMIKCRVCLSFMHWKTSPKSQPKTDSKNRLSPSILFYPRSLVLSSSLVNVHLQSTWMSQKQNQWILFHQSCGIFAILKLVLSETVYIMLSCWEKCGNRPGEAVRDAVTGGVPSGHRRNIVNMKTLRSSDKNQIAKE